MSSGTGMRTRREVLGDPYVDAALTRAAGTGDALQDLVTDNVWGDLWGRDELDRRSRSLVTVALLVAGGHHDELRAHTRGALRNGLTPAEVVEVVLHCSGYCGAPVALAAMRTVREVLDTA